VGEGDERGRSKVRAGRGGDAPVEGALRRRGGEGQHLKEVDQDLERGDGCVGMLRLRNGLGKLVLERNMSMWGQCGGIERAKVTFDGDKLDHDDAEPKAFIRAGLKLQLARNSVAGDEKRVGEGDGHLDLGMMGRGIHGFWPGLRHYSSRLEENEGRWTGT
jgi:hypothetical protein